jgi:phospholipid/cholesterol/gamma-HCH transport system permease protein
MIVLDGLARFGRLISDALIEMGDFTRFAWSAIVAIAVGRRAWGRWTRLGRQLYRIGVTSIPVLALTGAVTGAILAIEGYDQFAAFGQQDRLGMVVNISIVKQIGPLLAAIMLAGRVGCALAAELGSMRVTEQIDAMRVMGADPVHVLVGPRLVACVVMIPALTIVSNVCGVWGGWLVTTRFYGVDPIRFWQFSAEFIDWFDVFTGIFKSVFFGAAIALVACWKGFTCQKGAQGVGRATTESFVLSFVAIVMINLVLAKLLNDVDAMRLAAMR